MQDDQQAIAELRKKGKQGTDEWNAAILQGVTDANSLRVAEQQLAEEVKNGTTSLGEIRAALKEAGAQAHITGPELRKSIGDELKTILGYIRDINTTTIEPKVGSTRALQNLENLAHAVRAGI